MATKRNDVLFYSPHVSVFAAVRKWNFVTLEKDYNNNVIEVAKALFGYKDDMIADDKKRCLQKAKKFLQSKGESLDNKKERYSEEEWTYYDLSEDVVSCSVNLKINTPSTFSIVLQNSGGKYTDLFHNQDRVTITCHKDKDEIRLITGHITKSDVFQLNGENITIEGSCPLHQLELHYWDAKSSSGYNLLLEIQNKINASKQDASLTKIDSVLKILLAQVAGIDKERIHISDIPDDVVLAAKQLYLANADIIKGNVSIEGDLTAVDSSSVGVIDSEEFARG